VSTKELFSIGFNSLITAWLMARLPDESNTITLSPGRSNTVILRKVLMWSTPAFVRESDKNTSPEFT
jgi:hypothetical protein